MKKGLIFKQRFLSVPIFLILGSVFFFTVFLSAFQTSSDSYYKNYFSRMALIGVIISENSESSAAIFRNENSGDLIVLRIGETILDLELSQVLENRIILRKGDDTFQVFLGRGSFASLNKEASSTQPAQENPEQQIPVPLEIDSSAAVTKEFSRAELEKRLEEEWALLMQETRVVPNLEEGKISGFRITQMSDKSLLYEIGVRTDDIIKEVNGAKLDSLETVMLLYNKFKDLNNFEVIIQRRGKPLRFSYVLK